MILSSKRQESEDKYWEDCSEHRWA